MTKEYILNMIETLEERLENELRQNEILRIRSEAFQTVSDVISLLVPKQVTGFEYDSFKVDLKNMKALLKAEAAKEFKASSNRNIGLEVE